MSLSLSHTLSAQVAKDGEEEDIKDDVDIMLSRWGGEHLCVRDRKRGLVGERGRLPQGVGSHVCL